MNSKHGDAEMIDPTDKKTISLPLIQPKRGRGRPSTGAALTPAQKQKAYRERQKSNVTAKGECSIVLREALERLGERQIVLEKELGEWAKRAREAERKLKDIEAGNVTKKEVWQLQCKNEKGRWRVSDQYETERQAEDAMMKVHNPEFWRIRKK
ncbi:hypothetical protein [Pseudomonas sp. TMP9]|uniref:hypothetical protein n=1 Tax=Pseudomonas sp. TMP9 TaxID=3133144 RepID=UPI0030CF3CC4